MKPRGNLGDADVIIGFSFGFMRQKHIGRIYPGISDGKIGEVVLDLMRLQWPEAKGIPWILQWEVADWLSHSSRWSQNGSMKLIIKEHRIRGKYLDTAEVAEQAAKYMRQNNWLTAVVVAHPGHVRRCCNELEKRGIKVIVPDGLKAIPYDSESEQRWTRSPLLWWPRELAYRAFLALRSYFDFNK